MADQDGVVSLVDLRRGAGSRAAGGFQSEDWARLAHAADTTHFVATWLDIQCRHLDGVVRAVVVLRSGEGGAYQPMAVWPVGIEGHPKLAALVERALVEKAIAVDSLDRPNRTDPLFVAHPIAVDEELIGVVGLELTGRSEAAVRAGIQQIGWGLGWLETLAYRKTFTSKARLVTVLQLVSTSLRHARFQAAATAVATDLAAMFGCERVSIGFVQGNHCQLHALSHSAAFSKKSNLVRDIEAAMDEAADQLATVVHPPVAEGPAFQVTRAHETLLRAQGGGAVCTVPLTAGSQVLGAMVLELPAGATFDAGTVELCEHAAQLVGPVLDVKRKDDRWIGEKARDSLQQQARHLVGPERYALKLGAAAAVLLLLIFTFVQGDYRVTADASLEGTIQRAVTAAMPGYVAEARVRAGDIVKAGDLMALLDDRDLRLERTRLVGLRAQRASEYGAARADRQRAKSRVVEAQIAQVDAQLFLVDDQLKRTRVLAPFDGVVVKGDLSQSLGAPVERGAVLFELAPLDTYRIIMKVDERDIAAVKAQQTGTLALSSRPSDPVELVVDKITPVSVVEQGRNYFRVEAKATGEVQHLRPGMEGVAKIEIERRNLFWIWTHKLRHWVRMWFWSWWP